MVPHPPRLVRNIDPTPFVAWLKLDPSDGWNSPPIRMAASIPKRSSNISGRLAPAPPISEFWLPFVDSYRNFWAAGSAEMTGLVNGLGELGSFLPGI